MLKMTELTEHKAKSELGMLVKPKILHRGHVKRKLEGIFSTPLFFVISGMGSGKTTAVREFLRKKRQIKYIWFSFDREMPEDIWLWVKFCKTVEQINVQLGKKMLKYGIPQSALDLERLINSIASEMEMETVVVFDDMHLCGSKLLKGLVEKVAAANIPYLHIVTISRTEPLENAYMLVETGKAKIMTSRNFEFSKIECEDFFILNDAPLSDPDIDILYEKTKGWASGLYLALMHYMNGQSLSMMDSGPELIRTAFYDGLNENTKRSLLILSKLSNFTLDQAEFITKDRSIRSTLKRMYEYNCFTKYNEEAKTYSFHSILTDFFAEEFEKSDIDENAIYQLQGDWHLAVGERISAVSAYTMCGDNTRILEIMSEPNAVKLMNMAPNVIRQAFDKMSMKERYSNPIAYLTYIYSYSTTVDVKEGMKMLSAAKAHYEKARHLEDRNQIFGEIALIESIAAFNDIKRMFECYERANNYFDGGTSQIFSSDVVITFGVPLTMFLYHKEPGDMKEIVELIEERFWIFNHIANGCGAGLEHLIRAEYEYMQGNFDTAEMKAYKAIYKAQTKNQCGIILSASFLLLRMALFSGKVREVNEILMQMMDEVEKDGSQTMMACYEFILGYVFGYMGKPDLIPKWLTECNIDNAKLMAPARDTAYLIMGKIVCERGDYKQLYAISSKMEEIFNARKNLIGVMVAKIYQSISAFHLKGVDEAVPLMKEALSLAEVDGCYVTLAENTNEIISILEKMDEPSAKIVKELAEKYLESKEIFRRKRKPVNQLTKRECEVMDLVCDGFTAEAIGKILYVSMSTVKKHTAAAYEKLGVNKKADAIAAYRKITRK
jgi:LuxR family maltose regulon positive regulatory protein